MTHKASNFVLISSRVGNEALSCLSLSSITVETVTFSKLVRAGISKDGTSRVTSTSLVTKLMAETAAEMTVLAAET